MRGGGPGPGRGAHCSRALELPWAPSFSEDAQVQPPQVPQSLLSGLPAPGAGRAGPGVQCSQRPFLPLRLEGAWGAGSGCALRWVCREGLHDKTEDSVCSVGSSLRLWVVFCRTWASESPFSYKMMTSLPSH